MLRTDHYRASRVFRPIKEQIIDFTPEARRRFVDRPNAVDVVLASFLGLPTRELEDASGEPTDDLLERLQRSNPSLAAQVKAEFDRQNKRNQTPNRVDDYLSGSAKTRVAEGVLDFVVARHSVGFESWSTRNANDPAYVVAVRGRLGQAAIDDVLVTPSFPTSIAVYGYSRGDPEPGAAAVVAFERENNKHVLFGSENRSDAVLVQLSATKMLRRIGIEEGDDTKAKARMAELVATEDPLATPILTMLHSMSHLFLRAMTTWCGLDQTSMAEYLFPAAGAFAIYEMTGTGISMGGIIRMADKHLPEVIDDMNRSAENCMYDPVCLDRTGACFACCHLSEISCEAFNQGLDRRPLVMPGGLLRA